MENAWQRDFNIEINWSNVYMNQVWNIVDRKLAEFNYKLLCNIICTRNIISKWNHRINNKCPVCGQTQTVKHLIFECDRVKNLWILIGSILKVNITYKHIVVGNKAENDYIKSRNLLFSYVAYGVYKFWIMSENQKVNFNDSIQSFVKKDLFSRSINLNDQDFNKICDKIITEL